ncbi:MAG: primosomal protein N' [Kiritimatiellae bacterium]|nr:primosomal protein N' [Kiritimatiellia bacterium]
MGDRHPSVARVAVDLSTGRLFDYAIPDELRGTLPAGTPVVVPFGRAERRGYVVELRDRTEHTGTLKFIKSAAGREEMIRGSLLQLARWMADYYIAPIETAVRTVLPGAVRRAGAAFVERLMAAPTEAGRALDDVARAMLARRAPRQARALERLVERGETLLSRLEAEGADRAALRALEHKGYVRIWGGVMERSPREGMELLPTTALELMPQQRDALEAVKRIMDTRSPPVALLHGVTGSGKTEIYLQAIAHALEQGKGAIVLVPEISLTPQTVERFVRRFGEGVAVLHSGLADGERHDEWHRIRDGRARIVVGARSALFAPVDPLGLIVVDEEHESTYKQDEAPRYHARDVAVMRGHLEPCAVVLGSATPCLESWENARKGKYALIRMPHRVDHREMPEIRVIDLRYQGQGRDQRRGLFAKPLVEEIRMRVERSEQVILFLNRRGYASSIQCPACGEAVPCVQCSIAMTYHKREHRLVCHLCGMTRPLPDRCPNPECRDPSIRMAGAGTERVEETLRKLFPHVEIARMDSDTMTRKSEYRRVLDGFKSGRIRILVGTQMIAKGLHFPNVTLVGVINADLTLHLPDFRAGERTLQLITQVAGRAGRGEVPGLVIVQSFTPFHPAIQAARRMDYEVFCDQELEFRRSQGFPPFARMVSCLFRGKREDRVRATAQAFETAAQSPEPPPGGWHVTPAAPAALARIRDEYRWQVLLRGPRNRYQAMNAAVRSAFERAGQPGVHFSADVDPVHML